MANNFLNAEWRKLLMANYVVDKSVLEKYVPFGTELDLWENTCYVSLVGFMFLNTKIKGIKIPFHVNFEEVNLRFYVKYNDNGIWKRGVVFIKEIVPKPAISIIANTVYNEKYETMNMKHTWENNISTQKIKYQWLKNKKWNSIEVVSELNQNEILIGSEEEFITEHYWGYTQVNAYKTSEYEVSHPRWQVFNILNYNIDVDYSDVYSKEFEFLNFLKPKSVFLAEGSEIQVNKSKMI